VSDPIESNEQSEVTSDSNSVSRRRALGLGAAVAGGVWVAPAILSFDAASAAPSGTGPTTSTTAGPGSTTTTTEEPPTTTTTAVSRTITANVLGIVNGLDNPEPVTVAVGEPINLVFTRSPGYPYMVFYAFETGDGTATAGVDYTANSSFSEVMLDSESSTTITIQTTATGPGSNTAFTVTVQESA
jgi:hypothetical protein